jgi:type IV secretory pathway TrbL component
MSAGWIVPVIWFFLSIWTNLTINAIANIGYLGTIVQITPGWWAVCTSIAIGLLAVWSSWGLWPIKHKNRCMIKK